MNNRNLFSEKRYPPTPPPPPHPQPPQGQGHQNLMNKAMSQCYINASLTKICLAVKEISCIPETTTPMPTPKIMHNMGKPFSHMQTAEPRSVCASTI